MKNLIDHTIPAPGFLEGFMNPQTAIYLFAALLAIACAGALVGMMTRSLMTLLGIGALIFAFLTFHMYLPLPGDLQADIHIFKARIGL